MVQCSLQLCSSYLVLRQSLLPTFPQAGALMGDPSGPCSMGTEFQFCSKRISPGGVGSNTLFTAFKFLKTKSLQTGVCIKVLLDLQKPVEEGCQ